MHLNKRRFPAAAMLLPLAALLPACQFETSGDHEDALAGSIAMAPHTDATPQVPAPGQSTRVGGDTAIATTGSDGDLRADGLRIDTPLPVGYPPPTPPGAIDLKTYPSLRLAEVASTGNPDRQMNRAFWSLFNHIKQHDIAMTSPVEMTFEDPRAARTSGTGWTMAFLYRTPDMNRVGEEGEVLVRDAQPLTVVAVGLKGNYSMALVDRGMVQIEDWLAENPQWKPAGTWRTLYYNGPKLAWWNKWAEVQMPIEPAQRSDQESLP
jgi:hypothetical protein